MDYFYSLSVFSLTLISSAVSKLCSYKLTSLMIYFFPLSVVVSFISLLLLSRAMPLVYNIWLSVFTGVIRLLLLIEGNLTGALTLFIVEEALSLIIIML